MPKEGSIAKALKKEVIICIVVVIFVIIGNIITQGYTRKSVETTNAKLIELKEKLSKVNKDEEGLIEAVKYIKEEWDEKQEKLAFYIEHDELEKVETQIHLLSGEVEAKLYEDAVPETDKCMFILEHIKDKTALNVKNIF